MPENEKLKEVQAVFRGTDTMDGAGVGFAEYSEVTLQLQLQIHSSFWIILALTKKRNISEGFPGIHTGVSRQSRTYWMGK